jgi:hypothetical protein
MAAVAFDPLEYTHALEASGVPRKQAEVHAKAMTAMFIHNFDALVTKDYLDTRFDAFEAGVNANMDKRFGGVDKRFGGVDKRFGGVDKQFSELRLEMHSEFGAVRKEIWELRSTLKLQSWILTVMMAGIFVPMVQASFA